MKILVTVAVLAITTACASHVTNIAQSASETNQVLFRSSQARGVLTIECRPRSEAIGKTTAWVDICNRLGREELDQAADKRLIAPVAGPAFGMSSIFLKSVPADAPVSSKVMTRDVPLLGTAL